MDRLVYEISGRSSGCCFRVHGRVRVHEAGDVGDVTERSISSYVSDLVGEGVLTTCEPTRFTHRDTRNVHRASTSMHDPEHCREVETIRVFHTSQSG